MHHNITPKRGPKTLAFADAVLILAPLFIFLFILALNGNRESIFQKAEWSFITIFFLIEILRDQIKRQHLENYHADQTESGVIIYSLVLAVGVLFLYADFENSMGLGSISIQAFYTVKFSLLSFSFIFFLAHRYRKYKYQFSSEASCFGEELSPKQDSSR